jgi:hypothetical protein
MRASYGGQPKCRHLERRDAISSTVSGWRAKTPLPSYVCRSCGACLLLVVCLVGIAFRHLAVDIANALRWAEHPQSVGICGHHWIAFATTNATVLAKLGSLPRQPTYGVKVRFIQQLRARAPPRYTRMWLRRLCRCTSRTAVCGGK